MAVPERVKNGQASLGRGTRYPGHPAAYKAYFVPSVGWVEMNGSSGTQHYYYQNGLGSNCVDSKRSGGLVLKKTTEFEAYGEEVQDGWCTEDDAGASRNQFRFAGKHGYVTDEGTGLDLLGARFYAPRLGRFLTRDPIGHEGGLNLYAYANNNPLKFVDPDGTDRQLALERIGRNVPFIKVAAEVYDVPETLIAAVIWNEAAGNSPPVSRFGVYSRQIADQEKFLLLGRATLGIVQMYKRAKSSSRSERSVEHLNYIANEALQIFDAAKHLSDRGFLISGGYGPLNWGSVDFRMRVLSYYNANPFTKNRRALGYPVTDYGKVLPKIEGTLRRALRP